MKEQLKNTALKFFERKKIVSVGIDVNEVVGSGDIEGLSCYIRFIQGFEDLAYCRFEREFTKVQFEFNINVPFPEVEEMFDHHFRSNFLDNREFPCTECETGEMIAKSVYPNGQEQYECNSCGHETSFP